jgi:alpha-tubulin suppressor-like RCC1 family protein
MHILSILVREIYKMKRFKHKQTSIALIFVAFAIILSACSSTSNQQTGESLVKTTGTAKAVLSDASGSKQAVLVWSAPASSSGAGATDYNIASETAEIVTDDSATSLAISAGSFHNCVILNDSALKCFGRNNYGQLGLGSVSSRGGNSLDMGDSLLTINLGYGRTAASVSAGNFHTCVLLDSNNIKCFGRNGSGQLGYGNTKSRGDNPGEMGDNLRTVNVGYRRTVKAVSAGYYHTCAILGNNTLKCFGRNGSGQLGYGDTVNHGDNPGEMGDNLLVIDLGTGRTAKAVSAGLNHTCAILDNGSVKCFGNGNLLGLGDYNNRGDNPGEMGDALPTVDLGLGRTATAISVGYFHSCALLDNSTIKCWGQNFNGELGIGNSKSRGTAVGEMGDMLPIVDLGSGHNALSLSVSGSHSCALLETFTVKCWGKNYNGELGYGDTSSRGDNINEMGDFLPTVGLGTNHFAIALSAGGGQTCAILDDSEIKCWGLNNYGQLGQNDFDSRGDDALEMGDVLLPIDLGHVR